MSIAINLLLTCFQVVGGFFAHSQALMADGLHSLSDFLADVSVLYANRHGSRHADAGHPYGRARGNRPDTYSGHLPLGTRRAVLNHHQVMDVTVHIDPEDDLQARFNAHLPDRPGLLAYLAERLGDPGLPENRVVFHYLDGKVDAEIYLDASRQSAEQADILQARCDELVRDDELMRAIHVHRSHAQS